MDHKCKKNNQVQNETEMDIEFGSKQTDKQNSSLEKQFFYEKSKIFIVSPN